MKRIRVSSATAHGASSLIVFGILLSGSVLLAQPQPDRAMWVNSAATFLTDPDAPAARGELFAFSRTYGVTDLFFQTGYVCGRDGGVYHCAVRDASLLRSLLQEAQAWGLRVHALSGEPTWVYSANLERVLARVDATVDFNRGSLVAERFSGIHFDIEPQGLPEWKQGPDDTPETLQARRESLLTQFVTMHSEGVARLRTQPDGDTLVYGADIHYSFGTRNSSGSPQYAVVYNGVLNTAAEHLLARVDNLGDMVFRNHALDAPSGRRGIVFLAADTLESASRMPGRVFVAVKTTDPALNNEPEWTSFYGKTKAEMEEQELSIVIAFFGANPGFAGIAVQNYAGWRALPDVLITETLGPTGNGPIDTISHELLVTSGW